MKKQKKANDKEKFKEVRATSFGFQNSSSLPNSISHHHLPSANTNKYVNKTLRILILVHALWFW